MRAFTWQDLVLLATFVLVALLFCDRADWISLR
jgi:hypothetical protein